jgi:thiamine pyrophosphokinase
LVELLAPRAQDKGLEIAADIEVLPATLVGDADQGSIFEKSRMPSMSERSASPEVFTAAA